VSNDTLQTLERDKLINHYADLGIVTGSKIAVAVSGGADSLCLLLLSAKDFNVTALTVDHRLRSDSAKEAEWVAGVCRKNNIPHETLVWEGEKPDANIQANARDARYGLMQEWCKANKVATIVTAHHMDDQAETVMLRLARGSGVYGLAGMAPVRPLQDGVSLVRPLLKIPKEHLVNSLRAMNAEWVEDPSNRSEAYDRVKIRNMLSNPPVEGLNAARLAGTAERLRRSREALEYYEKQWLDQAVSFHHERYCYINVSCLSLAPEEVVLRGIASVCRFVGRGTYVPRMEKLLRLHYGLSSDNFRGQTLYGALFSSAKDGKILVTRELSSAENRKPASRSGVWDGHFYYRTEGNIKDLGVGPVGEDGWVQLKKAFPNIKGLTVPRLAVMALPAVFKGEQLQYVPFLEYNELNHVSFTFSAKDMN